MPGQPPPAEPVARLYVTDPEIVPSTPGRIVPLQDAEDDEPVKLHVPPSPVVNAVFLLEPDPKACRR